METPEMVFVNPAGATSMELNPKSVIQGQVNIIYHIKFIIMISCNFDLINAFDNLQIIFGNATEKEKVSLVLLFQFI